MNHTWLSWAVLVLKAHFTDFKLILYHVVVAQTVGDWSEKGRSPSSSPGADKAWEVFWFWDAFRYPNGHIGPWTSWQIRGIPCLHPTAAATGSLTLHMAPKGMNQSRKEAI